MSYEKKIVLYCPAGYKPRLNSLVEEFIRDGVIFVGVIGKDCVKVEDTIDEIVVGDGSRDYDLLTSSHPNETLEEAIIFANALTNKFKGKIQVIEL